MIARNPLAGLLNRPHPVPELRSYLISNLKHGKQDKVLRLFQCVPDSFSPEQIRQLNDSIFELFTGYRTELFPVNRIRRYPSDAPNRSPAFITVTPNPALDICGDLATLGWSQPDYLLDPGGKGFNMSVALRYWGITPISLGFLGGPYGSMVNRLLLHRHLPVDSLTPINRQTRCNMSVHFAGHGLARLTTSGPMVSTTEQDAFYAQFASMVKPGDMVLLGGSLPPGIDPSWYARLIGTARSIGAETYLDTSGAPLAKGVQALPAYLGVNLREFSELTGQTVEVMEHNVSLLASYMHSLIQKGIATVVVTMGSKGMVLATADGCWHALPPAVQELSATGAGDMVNVAFAYGHCRRISPREIVRLATAASAATVIKPGTGMAGPDETKALLEHVRIVEIR